MLDGVLLKEICVAGRDIKLKESDTFSRQIPRISVVIGTKNRGSDIVETVESILQNDYPDFDLTVVDQSTDEETFNAIRPFLEDGRFHFLRSERCGVSYGRNLGASHTTGEIIAFTDDDCLAPVDWLSTIAQIFQAQCRVAILFCNVKAYPHDTRKGFIPTYIRDNDYLVQTLWQKTTARGIGAGMAVRRKEFTVLGGFDTDLGPGARIPACEDGDLAVRMLLNGYWIYETTATTITHKGYRTWSEGKELTKRNWIGIGAAYAKPIKCHHYSIILVVLYEAIVIGLLKPLSKIFKLKRPSGVKSFLYFIQGFVQGLQYPIDCENNRYKFIDRDA